MSEIGIAGEIKHTKHGLIGMVRVSNSMLSGRQKALRVTPLILRIGAPFIKLHYRSRLQFSKRASKSHLASVLLLASSQWDRSRAAASGILCRIRTLTSGDLAAGKASSAVWRGEALQEVEMDVLRRFLICLLAQVASSKTLEGSTKVGRGEKKGLGPNLASWLEEGRNLSTSGMKKRCKQVNTFLKS